ncbi:polyketide synthase [Massariosphaeria phaeospora]|uniref:Polyketide synthase n=1 Tax=Massariosphaeria phaeospora TaxID=100035 RepID=A0A7C8IF93_9PLEO|nr:polyketide synthase [Massariosphaeria phaeospora]
MAPQQTRNNEPIAIIGSGCRFPGSSNSPSRLWDLLKQPRDVLSTIPVDRFNTNGVYHPDGMRHGATNVRSSYLLAEDHRLFDAGFFKIKPVEAQAVDPQQRLLMETVYEALENAGLSMESLRGSDTAVFVGLMANEYADMLSNDIDHLPTYFATATAASIMSNRVNYFFDWHGPSMTIDTACSSSLVAVHQAVQTLRNGESKVAVAAGANLILGPKPYISENKLNMLSPGSRSRMWDVDADGYARGEGTAALVLKSLSQAVADGDEIDCIIRETGVNQDGRTKGITMPSSVAQEMLIRETYAKAGLDLSSKRDRPQFFEAHGTGTPAGDPQEAAAIRNAFFGANGEQNGNEVLYVGSIKTVIGHTEGTAGIAGILKAMMAMKDSTIPPNMLFNTLSPKVAPFYGNIQIPTAALPWPDVPAGQPLRASVNSFGFGGTNAHAILESYNSPSSPETSAPAFLPVTFSAASESSLRRTVESFTAHLKDNQSTSVRDLAHTLNFRRSKFPLRASFSSTSTEQLVSKLQAFLDQENAPITTATPNENPKILGVFTGQGAQWPTMARELILHSESVRGTVQRLEKMLAELPEADRPSWSLTQELLAEASVSQLHKAALSQPLCTVVQIILVDMLRTAGIHFDAVVGHSSGEIGAAYAAGYISAKDALKIAYYRGVHSSKAASATGAQGAMMAVGTTFEDATELCELEDLAGRIAVAACNSSSSVTLSGDIDAIEEAMATLQDEKKFARKLKVDTAYHSHHMTPYAEPYIRSLEECDIQILPGAGSTCTWFSSVTKFPMTPEDTSLKATYWSDNMTMPVMFAQALEAALAVKFKVAFELGPHPALKGPALQGLGGAAVPYTGLLQRGVNDIEAVADALAYASNHISDTMLNLKEFDKHMSGGAPARLLKGLPSYSFDHDRVYWAESRIARLKRTRDTPVHELLGTLSVEGSPHERRWRNVISPSEIPWLTGHQLQGQTVFPAAGYVAMAVEAAREIASKRSVRLLEMEELIISKAMVFESDEATAEVLFMLTIDREASTDEVLHATFVLEGTTNQQNNELVTFFSGSLTLHFGEVEQNLLPGRATPLIDAVDVDSEHFYTSLTSLGYEYSGSFKALQAMKRATDSGTGNIIQPQDIDLLVHPATLDCAIQAVILAFSWPGDNRLWSLHVPTKITRFQLNPTLLASDACRGQLLSVDSYLASDVNSSKVAGDVSIYGPDASEAVMQLEGVEIVPFTAASPEMDARLFFNFKWDVASPHGELITRGIHATPEHYAMGESIDRVAYLYLKAVLEDTTEEDWAKAESHFRQFRIFGNEVVSAIESGKQPGCDPAWKDDTRAQIDVELTKRPGNIELRLIKAVGENLVAAIRGETMILEHMLHDNVLNEFYREGLGLDTYTEFLNNAVQQVAHRHANMNILEIGAGTGGVTKTIIKDLGNAFASYTYTDISSGFFDTAREVFRKTRDRMVFKTLDVEKDPLDQGFQEHSYDLIVCSLVLHATESLEATLTNVRRLLKPGGYLLLMEITNTISFRTGFAMSALPGWWLGAKDGRPMNPCVPAERWDQKLKKTGYTGIEALTPATDPIPWPYAIIVARATDEQVQLTDRPLSYPPEYKLQELVMIGGASEATQKLGDELEETLQPWYQKVIRIHSVEEYNDSLVAESASVLSFMDLDTPYFKDLTDAKLKGLSGLFERSRNAVWITKGARGADPYATAMTGFARSLVMEMPHLRLQLLDLGANEDAKSNFLAETVLRLEVTESWEKDDSSTKMLWSTEPELALENGILKIPRLYGVKEQNDRFNSNRRHVLKEVDPVHSNVLLTASGSSTVELSEIEQKDLVTNGAVTVRVNYSLPAVRVSSGQRLFVISGTLSNNDEEIIALSPTLASQVSVPNKWTVSVPRFPGNKADFLATVGFELIASYLVEQTPSGSTILMNEAPKHLTQVIIKHAEKKNVQPMFLTSKAASKSFQAQYVHPHASARVIRSKLPSNVTVFADFGRKNALSSSILQSLPPSCFATDATDLLNSVAFERPQVQDNVSALLHSATRYFAEKQLAEASVTSLREVLKIEDPALSHVIDWTAFDTVPVKVGPVDSLVSFKPDKTYILFGLTGQIGRSLALWMAGQGAKHIVLTSRNPVVDELWLTKARDKGAEVHLLANDITDRDAVRALIDGIRATMPPIAGVANGAMILHDSSVPDMTLETMIKVLRPKVNGTVHLDELFQDNSLDFFIVFTSVANVFGHHGQSNYTAANTFMNGLVHRRRIQGLAGSAMAIGAVMGLGYMWREVDDSKRRRIEDMGFRRMSERDLHQVFGEAVLASPRGIGEDPLNHEVISGIREMEYGKDRNTTNPIFGHVTIHPRASGAAEQESTAKVALKMRLLSATTEMEAYANIQDAFLGKLKSILQLSDIPGLDSGADELGVDSLIAVEIRSWFLKELYLDMPVLKILGGATVEAMIDFAIEKLPAEMLPNVEHKDLAVPIVRLNGGPSTKDSSTASVSSKEFSDQDFVLTPNTQLDSLSLTARTALMSYGQTRFWFLGSLLDDPIAFNITFSLELHGHIELEKLARAVEAVARRHSALRTRFYDSDDGKAMQEVLEFPAFRLQHRDIARAEDIQEEFERLKSHEYDLANGDLMQLTLLRGSSNAHTLLIGYHHINMDVVSLKVLLTDIDKAYHGMQLSPDVLQYPDYAAEQRRAFEDGKMDTELSYWRREFADFPAVLPLLPFSDAHTRQAQTSYSHSKVQAKIPLQLATRIKAACSKHRISPFHFHLAAFQTLLARFLSVDDFSIGMADANRNELAQLEAIGLYLNLLPLRLKHDGAQTFVEAAKQAQSKVRQALAHSRIPFDVLIDQLKPERSMQHSPIFQAFIDYKPPMPEKTEVLDCKVGKEDYEIGQTAYDITLSIVDEPNGAAEIVFQLQKSLYSTDDASVLLKSYLWLLEQFGSHPEATVDSVSLISAADVQEAVRVGAGPIVRSEWPETISHRVQQIIERHPDAPALVDEGRTFSYRALNSKINTLTTKLLDMKIYPGSVVAVCQEPGLEWLASFLAVLRIGAVYLPFDVRTPVTRLIAVAKEAQPIAVLAHTSTLRLTQSLGPRGPPVINVSSLVKKRTDKTIQSVPTVQSPAYIFYTSGTSGKPKGVLVGHAGLPNGIEYMASACRIGQGSRIMQQSAFSFDASVLQTLLGVATGACLVFASQSQRADPVALVDLIVSQKVNVLFGTPSEYLWWMQSTDIKTLQQTHILTAITGGEKLKQTVLDVFKSLQKQDLEHWDAYGPTEMTIFCNMVQIDYRKEYERIPLGPAIHNTAVYVVDENLRPVPVGISGEIMLAGVGVAQGYLNSELTKARFVPNPFASSEFIARGWTTMYRSGDKGRLGRDGTLSLDGRISGDTQVKIRGVRMELQDIEKNIIATAGGDLVEGVVSVRGDPPFLVAHVAFAKDKTPKDSETYLQKLLASLPLPHYMCPTVLVPLNRLPVTQNCKLDRAAIQELPLPRTSQSSQADVELSESQRQLRAVWCKVLPKDVVDVQVINDKSDFFHIGGNSMLLARVGKEMNNRFGVKIPLVQLFEKSTLGEMAQLIDSRTQAMEGTQIIDWEAEIALPDDLSAGPDPKCPPRAHPKVIVLTGSTGFLGRTILKQLLDDANIEKIHCVAVRDGATRALPEEFTSPKVVVHPGSLTQPQFGLSHHAAHEIFDEADAIIHNSADVSFLKSYRTLRPINVDATKAIFNLAIPRRIPFHYVSTSGVAHLSNLPEYPEISVAAYRPPTDGSDGYVASKWASEVYLEKASQVTGVPVTCQRPSSIMGDDVAPTDLMGSLFKYSLQLKAVPILKNRDQSKWDGGHADLIDVANVARGILESVRAGGTPWDPVRILYQSGEMVVPMGALVGGDDAEGGLGLEAIPVLNWVERARKEGMSELVGELLSSAEDNLRGRTEEIESFLLYPKLVKGKGA